jgi:hypothetical protein
VGPLPGRGLEAIPPRPPGLDDGKATIADLAPVQSGDGSGLPIDLWAGLDIKQLEELVAPLQVPPRSGVLHDLWSRIFSAEVPPPSGAQSANHFLALQLEVLFRSGRLADMDRKIEKSGNDPDDALLTAFRIRSALAANDRQRVCDGATSMQRRLRSLPKGLAGEVGLVSAYCAAAHGDLAAAQLAADLARDDGVEAPLAFAIVDALVTKGKLQLSLPSRIVLLDYRMMELIGPVDVSQILDKAEPALVSALTTGVATDIRSRVAAAEAGARLHALGGRELADVWRHVGSGHGTDPLLKRAHLFQAAVHEATPAQRGIAIRALLDESRRSGLLVAASQAIEPSLKDSPPETGLDAAVAAEVFLTTGRFNQARRFAQAGGAATAHWLALIDVIDPNLGGSRERHIEALDALARRGRLSGDLLNRLATVLDALDINVPIPLWEAASRSQQRAGGYLPDTGVLPQLHDAAKKKDVARTILLSMRTLGPAGADGAHLIALGDSIRALRRVGLDREARRLGLEALLAEWPRAS